MANNRTNRGTGSARSLRAAADTTDYIEVVYQGPHGNHFIASPTKKVKYYAYGGFGTKLMVHKDDVKAKPHLFVPILQPAAATAVEPKLVTTTDDEGVLIELLEPILVEGGQEGDVVKMEVSIEEVPDTDLTQITGVGPARAEKLQAAGVTSVGDVANKTVEELMAILDATERAAGTILASAKELVR